MTDWHAAGRLADAHRTMRLIANRYDNPAKRRVRDRALRFLAGARPALMLDAWGGGLSAAQAAEMGLEVLSVDDGRSFADYGVTKERGRRALEIAGREHGYRTAFGALESHAGRCDAAFLDFCGHWSPSMQRVIRACAHMKALVVTVMPERTPLGRLSSMDWQIAMRALIESHSGMRTQWVNPYERSSGLSALCIALRAVGRAISCARQGCANPLPNTYRHTRYCSRECGNKVRTRAYYYAHRDELRRKARAYQAAHRDELRRKSLAYYYAHRQQNLDVAA